MLAAPDEDRTRDLRIMRPTRCQLRHRGMVAPPLVGVLICRLKKFGKKRKRHSKIKLRHGESNPGHLRDRQRCYQLHHDGRKPPARIELATLRLLSACSAN